MQIIICLCNSFKLWSNVIFLLVCLFLCLFLMKNHLKEVVFEGEEREDDDDDDDDNVDDTNS